MLRDFLYGVDANTFILILFFMILFTFLHWILFRVFKNRATSGIISFCIALMAVYGFNRMRWDLSGLAFRIGISENLLYIIVPILIVLFLIFLFWKLKFSGALMLIGGLLIVSSLLDLFYEKMIMLIIGIVLFLLGLFLWIRKKFKGKNSQRDVNPYRDMRRQQRAEQKIAKKQSRWERKQQEKENKGKQKIQAEKDLQRQREAERRRQQEEAENRRKQQLEEQREYEKQRRKQMLQERANQKRAERLEKKRIMEEQKEIARKMKGFYQNPQKSQLALPSKQQLALPSHKVDKQQRKQMLQERANQKRAERKQQLEEQREYEKQQKRKERKQMLQERYLNKKILKEESQKLAKDYETAQKMYTKAQRDSNGYFKKLNESGRAMENAKLRYGEAKKKNQAVSQNERSYRRLMEKTNDLNAKYQKAQSYLIDIQNYAREIKTKYDGILKQIKEL